LLESHFIRPAQERQLQNFFGYGISLLFFIVGVSIPMDRGGVANTAVPTRVYPDVFVNVGEHSVTPSLAGNDFPGGGPYEGITFRHGDISWLPRLATIAGWSSDDFDKLGTIILRESGGCPYRKGGDRVDENCNIIKVTEWNHRSDTGLMQINGVHWKTDHRDYHGMVCRELDICDNQEALMDPITNLRAGKLIFDKVGWAAWDPCEWGPKYAKQCKPNGGKGKKNKSG
jgi:hypothetical protein